MSKLKIKPCPLCGWKPIIEHWSSGGIMYMVKCNNPDCPAPVNSYPTGRNLNDVEDEWNKRVTWQTAYISNAGTVKIDMR